MVKVITEKLRIPTDGVLTPIYTAPKDIDYARYDLRFVNDFHDAAMIWLVVSATPSHVRTDYLEEGHTLKGLGSFLHRTEQLCLPGETIYVSANHDGDPTQDVLSVFARLDVIETHPKKKRKKATHKNTLPIATLSGTFPYDLYTTAAGTFRITYHNPTDGAIHVRLCTKIPTHPESVERSKTVLFAGEKVTYKIHVESNMSLLMHASLPGVVVESVFESA